MSCKTDASAASALQAAATLVLRAHPTDAELSSNASTARPAIVTASSAKLVPHRVCRARRPSRRGFVGPSLAIGRTPAPAVGEAAVRPAVGLVESDGGGPRS